MVRFARRIKTEYRVRRKSDYDFFGDRFDVLLWLILHAVLEEKVDQVDSFRFLYD